MKNDEFALLLLIIVFGFLFGICSLATTTAKKVSTLEKEIARLEIEVVKSDDEAMRLLYKVLIDEAGN